MVMLHGWPWCFSSTEACNNSRAFPQAHHGFSPNQPNTVKSKNAQFSFPETAFYDTVLFVVQEEPAGTKMRLLRQ